MPKTPGDTLIQDIAEDFHTYLARGIQLDSVVGKAHPELDVNDLDSLLRIHFVLTEMGDDPEEVGVVDFIHDLESDLRHLKTTTERRRELFHGQVRGRVDWSSTAEARSRSGQPEAPLFVCSRPEVNYEVEENIVLKRLLSVIHDIVFGELGEALDDPDRNRWLEDWVDPLEDGRTAAEHLREVFEENIYLQRISVEERDVTDRMIRNVQRSRNQLYRDAATLLDRYRKIRNQKLDSEEVASILNHTMIAPEATDVVFELYWVFQLLGEYDDVEYLPLRKGDSSKIARWKNTDGEYVMYHDATGEAVNFRVSADEIEQTEDGFLYRLITVLEKWGSLSEELFGRDGSQSLWGGRPDILIERYETNNEGNRALVQAFVGEVKYTRDTGYAASGLRELLEYMALIKRVDDEEYLEDDETLLESDSVHGLLFVDEVDSQDVPGEDIDVLSYGDEISKPI